MHPQPEKALVNKASITSWLFKAARPKTSECAMTLDGFIYFLHALFEMDATNKCIQ